jgi:hypothetical protein
MAALVVTLTTTTASAAQTAAADTLSISVIGAAAAGGYTLVEISDNGTNWTPAILGAPNGTKEIKQDIGMAFTLRSGWRWRASVVDPTAGTYSVRVAVE